MTRYGALTREELEARLALAEDVCAMFSWSPARWDTDRDKASHELWLRWSSVAGTNRADFPHLTDDVITELAAKRDATRAATLARLPIAVDPDLPDGVYELRDHGTGTTWRFTTDPDATP